MMVQQIQITEFSKIYLAVIASTVLMYFLDVVFSKHGSIFTSHTASVFSYITTSVKKQNVGKNADDYVRVKNAKLSILHW